MLSSHTSGSTPKSSLLSFRPTRGLMSPSRSLSSRLNPSSKVVGNLHLQHPPARTKSSKHSSPLLTYGCRDSLVASLDSYSMGFAARLFPFCFLGLLLGSGSASRFHPNSPSISLASSRSLIVLLCHTIVYHTSINCS